MKKIIILVIFGLIISSKSNAQYSEGKIIYDHKDYVYQPDDPYNPSLARKYSFMLPGLGHAKSGELGRGVPFMAGYLIFAGMGGYGLGILFLERILSSAGENVEGSPWLPYFLVGLGGMVGLGLWSANDAEKIAKVNNLAWRDKQKTSFNLSIEPYCGTSFKDKEKSFLAPGLSLKINF